MIHDSKTPHDIKPCLVLHIEQIVEDAREYEWETGVRRWSEEVFSRITKGRLFKGWHSVDERQRMRMILAQSKPLAAMPQRSYNPAQNRDNFNRRNSSQAQPHLRSSRAVHPALTITLVMDVPLGRDTSKMGSASYMCVLSAYTIPQQRIRTLNNSAGTRSDLQVGNTIFCNWPEGGWPQYGLLCHVPSQ